MTNKAGDVLQQWLDNRISAEQADWLQSQITKISTANSDRDLHITLGLIPRKLSRTDLALSTTELADAFATINHWNPSNWSLATAARIMVLCRLAEQNPDGFGDTITDLCRNADLAEGIALYSGIMLYPHSEKLSRQIGEGLRTHIRAVFEAIAHNNPYPAQYFDENRWNHMVLKALFIDSKLFPIQGLDERANEKLASILCDYAHERWAANREVSVELWRCVGPFATGKMIDDLQHVIDSTATTGHQAAALALSQCPDPRAGTILKRYPQTTADIANGITTWDAISSQPGTETISSP